MSLDMYYFDKNREFVTQTASIMEEAIREAGFDFVNCTDEFLKEITESPEVAEHIEINRETLQRNNSLKILGDVIAQVK